MTETTHLGLPIMAASQAQKHVTYNGALRLLDGIAHLSVLSGGDTTPPGSPSDGDRYLIGAGATGAWSSWDGSIGYFVDGAWVRLVPNAGWQCYVEDTTQALIFDGSDWRVVATVSALSIF